MKDVAFVDDDDISYTYTYARIHKYIYNMCVCVKNKWIGSIFKQRNKERRK